MQEVAAVVEEQNKVKKDDPDGKVYIYLHAVMFKAKVYDKHLAKCMYT